MNVGDQDAEDVKKLSAESGEIETPKVLSDTDRGMGWRVYPSPVD